MCTINVEQVVGVDFPSGFFAKFQNDNIENFQ